MIEHSKNKNAMEVKGKEYKRKFKAFNYPWH